MVEDGRWEEDGSFYMEHRQPLKHGAIGLDISMNTHNIE